MSESKAVARLVTREVTTTETVREGITLHLTEDEAHALVCLIGPTAGKHLYEPYRAVVDILGSESRDNPRFVLSATGDAFYPVLVANPKHAENASA